MKPRVGVVQFNAVCPEGNEHPLACGITYEIARRLTSAGGVDANAILLGNGAAGVTVVDAPAETLFPPDKPAGFSVPSLGAQYESDYILLGKAQVSDGLLFYYRVYEVEKGQLIYDGCVTGLRSSVFRLLDEVAQKVREAIGLPHEEEQEQDFNPVFEGLDFEAFTKYCLGRVEERPREAMERYEKALSLEPAFRMALVEYLSLCYHVDEMASSVKVLNAYLSLHPEDHEILIAASNLCLAFHRVDEGIGYANRAFVNRPNDVEPRVILARFLFAKEMSREARAHLDASMRSADSSPEGYYCLGRYFLDLGDFYRSRAYFEKCLGSDPNFYVALRDLQCCYYELGDFSQGINACERLLESDPTDAGSYYNLGLIYQRLGRTSLAGKFFEEALRQDPEFYKALYMIAENHYSRGDYEPALERFEQAHRLSPESVEMLGRIGDCHFQLGQMREASRYYNSARRSDSSFESARYCLIEGRTLAEAGDLAGARQQFLRATELDDELMEAWNELGLVLLRLRKPEEAVKVLRRAIEAEPRQAALLANLLTCCAHLSFVAGLSRWARRLRRETRERIAHLKSRGIVPPIEGRRTFRSFWRSWSWCALR
jgi:tetratricopeptide (TPR) repeat protein